MSAARPAPERWTVICRVVDNFGDAAILWRLSRQLAREYGATVRLCIDQPDVLTRLVPEAAPGTTVDGVSIERLDSPAGGGPANDGGEPARTGQQLSLTRPQTLSQSRSLVHDTDVIVTGFHDRLPPAARAELARMPRQGPGRRPLLIHFEHLSAETWIEGCHGLPSPGADGVVEYFFYPGFTAATGGLLREADLLHRRDAHVADPTASQRVLAGLSVKRAPGELLASLLCYPSAPLSALAEAMATSPHRLRLLAPNAVVPQPGIAELLERRSRGRLTLTRIPFVAQRDYDALLWSCDINFVRGEDSWIRGLWSGKPFLWQAYPQPEAVHHDKLNAFLDRFDAGASLLGDWVEANRGWNGLASQTTIPALLDRLGPIGAALTAAVDDWRSQPGNQSDLAARLVDFASSRL